MELYLALFSLVWQLRPAFSRTTTFFWGILVILSFCTRKDFLGGVSSFVRAIGIRPRHYQNLLDFFQSDAISLEKLSRNWIPIVFKTLNEFMLKENGHIILVIDGIKIGKEGVRMPGVKSLHQESAGNTKPAYIMGHSFQVISVLVEVKGYVFAVPLIARIHEGTKLTNWDQKTLMDKAVSMLKSLSLDTSFYLVGDAYYSVKKIFKGITSSNGHMITRLRSTAVAWEAYHPAGKRGRGRPKKYGRKINLKDLFCEKEKFVEMESPVYNEKDVKILVRSEELINRRTGEKMKYVLVIHPSRGKIILVSTDLSLKAESIIRIYGLRFKIEVSFKSAVHTLGMYEYRFWMKEMKKTRKGDGTKHLHKETEEYRQKYLKKLEAYHLYVQFGLIAQGILQCLSILHSEIVWKNFNGWIRTIRKDVLPSETVVSMALQQNLFEFLACFHFPPTFKKFIGKKVDLMSVGAYRRAA